eukprot:1530060-Alexandrium_andersonii.AAC.1
MGASGASSLSGGGHRSPRAPRLVPLACLGPPRQQAPTRALGPHSQIKRGPTPHLPCTDGAV